MRSKIRATLMWLRGQRWLVPAGTVLSLLAAGAVGAIPILLAPTTGWRWVAVFASPTLGFVTVVVIMEVVHRVERLLVRLELIPEPPPPPPPPTLEEEEALLRAMRDPREPDETLLAPRSAPQGPQGAVWMPR